LTVAAEGAFSPLVLGTSSSTLPGYARFIGSQIVAAQLETLRRFLFLHSAGGDNTFLRSGVFFKELCHATVKDMASRVVGGLCGFGAGASLSELVLRDN
jgi:hypothetical protein